MIACRHDRYRIPYMHVLDCWDRAECIAWHCIRCGVVFERAEMGKAVQWTAVGYDPLVHIADMWGRKAVASA